MDVFSDIISDITDNSPVQDYFEIVNLFKLQIQTGTVDALKLKCKSNNIQSYSKLKQHELVDCLLTFFTKILDIVKELNLPELKNICKNNGLKGFSSLKKSELISLIMNYNAACSKPEFIYKVEQSKENKKERKEEENKAEEKEIKKVEGKEEKLSKSELLEQLEQIEEKERKEEEERKMKEKKELEEKERKELEEKKKEKERKIKEDKEKKEQEKKERKEQEKLEKTEEEEKKKESKKQAIPKAIKKIVWDTYIGPDIIKHRCLCCKRVVIDNTNFHCGHVISEKDGGTLETGNLRPICSACNHSMGTENMIEFVKKYGLFIG
jgi:hypothetical protein